MPPPNPELQAALKRISHLQSERDTLSELVQIQQDQLQRIGVCKNENNPISIYYLLLP